MNAKVIGPLEHGVLDYVFASMHALAPALFNLRGPARTVCYGFAASHAGLAAITDYPAGVKKTVPFSTHGKLDLGYLPAMLAVPAVAGALRQRNARRYFTTMFALGAATWLMTDFRRGSQAAKQPQKRLPRTVDDTRQPGSQNGADAGMESGLEAVHTGA